MASVTKERATDIIADYDFKDVPQKPKKENFLGNDAGLTAAQEKYKTDSGKYVTELRIDLATQLGVKSGQADSLADYFVGIYSEDGKFKQLNGVVGNGSVLLESGKLSKDFIETTLKSTDLQYAIDKTLGLESDALLAKIGDFRNGSEKLTTTDANNANLEVNVQAAHNGYRYDKKFKTSPFKEGYGYGEIVAYEKDGVKREVKFKDTEESAPLDVFFGNGNFNDKDNKYYIIDQQQETPKDSGNYKIIEPKVVLAHNAEEAKKIYVESWGADADKGRKQIANISTVEQKDMPKVLDEFAKLNGQYPANGMTDIAALKGVVQTTAVTDRNGKAVAKSPADIKFLDNYSNPITAGKDDIDGSTIKHIPNGTVKIDAPGVDLVIANEANNNQYINAINAKSVTAEYQEVWGDITATGNVKIGGANSTIKTQGNVTVISSSTDRIDGKNVSVRTIHVRSGAIDATGVAMIGEFFVGKDKEIGAEFHVKAHDIVLLDTPKNKEFYDKNKDKFITNGGEVLWAKKDLFNGFGHTITKLKAAQEGKVGTPPDAPVVATETDTVSPIEKEGLLALSKMVFPNANPVAGMLAFMKVNDLLIPQYIS